MDREIEKVKKQYEEKQRRKRDKEKDGEKTDDKKKADDEEESKKAEKERDDKVCRLLFLLNYPTVKATSNPQNNRSNLYRMQLALWMLAQMTCLEYTHSTSMCDVKRPLDVCIANSYILTASAGTSTKCGLID